MTDQVKEGIHIGPWTVTLTRTLSAVIMGPYKDKEEVKEIAWNDAMEKGIIKQEEIDDSQWIIEVKDGAALQWADD